MPPQTTLTRRILQLPAGALVLLVRCYQYTLSPLMGVMGVQCRFQPTCSHYFIGAVQKYGAVRGAWRGTLRLCRCHPFHAGGYDPP
jgi:putative membrane protein insertion efficiency factor